MLCATCALLVSLSHTLSAKSVGKSFNYAIIITVVEHLQNKIIMRLMLEEIIILEIVVGIKVLS